ncbi:MAG: SAM-dependent methyltransferase [Bacteroidales bacterium]|nr:SAM-dependent methyltransferase [Bacteroidales bacterium]
MEEITEMREKNNQEAQQTTKAKESTTTTNPKDGAKGTLYMLPCFMSSSSVAQSFPERNVDIMHAVKHFAVENERTTRRFLKSVDKSIDIDQLTMVEMSKRTPPQAVTQILKPALGGEDIAMVSEAGCPGVADPGAELAAEAHRMGIKVVPLVGPSSILMGLMASGLNGQNFAFRGYLPIGSELTKELNKMEERSRRENQTQIFIETPYRNDKMFQTLLTTLGAETRLCVARDVTGPDEMVVTHKIKDWKKISVPTLNKIPTVFLFLA